MQIVNLLLCYSKITQSCWSEGGGLQAAVQVRVLGRQHKVFVEGHKRMAGPMEA